MRKQPIVLLAILFVLLIAFFSKSSFGVKKPRQLTGIPSGTQQVDKPLKVTGQTRTLSMMLVLKNDKDKLRFIQPRQQYRKEISGTHWNY